MQVKNRVCRLWKVEEARAGGGHLTSNVNGRGGGERFSGALKVPGQLRVRVSFVEY